MKKQIYLAPLSAALLALQACSFDDTSKHEQSVLQESAQKAEVTISRDVIDEMITSLPQPIEIADIITRAKMPFSKEMLVPGNIAEHYPDKYYQAMGFGAYGVDLGYINLNDKKLFVVEYLESIKTLSENLKVQKFFNFQTLYDMATNRNNPDSLINMSTRNFNQIDEFLREEDRGELSILILIGAWVEGMHMFGKIADKQPSDDIKKRIGEQKVVLENVMAILDKLSVISHFKTLKQDFKPVSDAYSHVTISYIYNKPETKEVNGELVIIDKTETKVEIDDKTIKEIIAGIENVRARYLLIQK